VAPFRIFTEQNDSDYLLKVAAGSVGGASAIKYGSIIFPDLTRPNIINSRSINGISSSGVCCSHLTQKGVF
jgi:hypothetical protein